MHLSELWCSFPLVKAVTSLLPVQASGNKDYSRIYLELLKVPLEQHLSLFCPAGVSQWFLFSQALNTIMEKSCSDESLICYSTLLLIFSFGHKIKNMYVYGVVHL